MKKFNNIYRHNNVLFRYFFAVIFFSNLMISSVVIAKVKGSWLPVEQPLRTGSSRTLLSTEEGLYASSSSGLYFSPDNGQSWQLITDQSIIAESLMQTKSKQLIVGTYRNGLLKVDPKTKRWQRIALSDAIYIRDIVSIGNTIFVSSASTKGDGGVYSSQDNGASWQATSLSETFVLSLSSPDKKRLFANTTNGLYLSNDLGQTWSNNNDGLGENMGVSQVILVNNQLLAATGSLRSPGRGIFRFDPVANKWQQYGTGMPDRITVNTLFLKGKQLIAATDTLDNFDGIKQGIFISDDYGLTWQSANFDNKVGSDISISSTGDMFIGTEGSGIWRSKDLKNWSPVNKGIRNWDIFSIYQTKNHDLLAASQNGIWRLSSKTNKWLAPEIRLGASTFQKTNNKHLLSTAENSLLIADEQGSNWQKLPMDGQYLIDLFVDDNRWYAIDLRKPVKYSDDNGKSWQILPIPGEEPARSIIKTNNGDLLVSNYNGFYRSTDNGKTWQLVDKDFLVWKFAKNDKGYLFASVYDRGMYRSKDNGQSWHEINTGFGKLPIHSAWSILTVNDTVYLAAYNRGFYKSTDNGDTWQAMNQGLNDPLALSLFITESGKIYGGTSAGIYQWKD